jgi:predicted MFS family arabinose efflux permease
MGSGLYEAAFATVVRLYGQDARRAITGITLFAGFASTVGWPLSSYLAHEFGWRGMSGVGIAAPSFGTPAQPATATRSFCSG